MACEEYGGRPIHTFIWSVGPRLTTKEHNMPKKRRRNPNDYKPPAYIRQQKRDKQYIAFQQSPRLNKEAIVLRTEQQCTTILGGKKIWKRGQRADGSQYRFPIIVGGQRCPNSASSSFRPANSGRTVRQCNDHVGIEWVENPTDPTNN